MGGISGTGGMPSAGGTTSTKLVATAITAGTEHTCAVLSKGAIQCWGNNGSGELGNGTTTDSSVPVTAIGITNAVAVVAGGWYTCAMLSGGIVQCWGDNAYGELGNGSTADCTVTSCARKPSSILPIRIRYITSTSRPARCPVLQGARARCGCGALDGIGRIRASGECGLIRAVLRA